MTVTLFIIGFTSAISLTALYIYPRLQDWGMLRPYRTLRQKNWHELLTAGFLHANFPHLLVNMFVLFFFGVELERTLGPVHLTAVYLSGLLISSLPTLVKFRDDPNYATIGASGAVGSILFAFIFIFPTENLYLIFFPVPIPAWLFAILYLAYSIYESNRRRGKINHEAHIAGSVWGIIYMIAFVPNSLDHILTILGVL